MCTSASWATPRRTGLGYRNADTTALNLHRSVLLSSGGRSALRHVTELLDGGAVALLCFERDHAECHRHQVVNELGNLCQDLRVTYA